MAFQGPQGRGEHESSEEAEMNCQLPNCPAEVRWHNTLCQQHAKMVPKQMQYRIGQVTANLLRSQRPLMVQAWKRKYRAALREAVAAVKSLEVA